MLHGGADLVGVHGGGAQLGHDHAGREVGHARGVFQRAAGRQAEAEHGDHGVAGAGDVEDLLRLRRDVQGLAGVPVEAHAALAARDEHGLAVEALEDAPADQVHLGVGLRRKRSDALHRLLQVRGDAGDAAVAQEVLDLRVHGDELAAAARQREQRLQQAGVDHALAVVGKHDAFGLADAVLHAVEQEADDLAAERLAALAVEAHDLLVARDHAGLQDGRAGAVLAHAVHVHAALPEGGEQEVALGVVADDGDQERPAA
jgi:hypothetical protein